jgi:hypothetical protein
MVNCRISTTFGRRDYVTVIPGQTDLNGLVKTFTDVVFPESKKFIVSVRSEDLDVIYHVDFAEDNNFKFPDATYFNITVCESIL